MTLGPRSLCDLQLPYASASCELAATAGTLAGSTASSLIGEVSDSFGAAAETVLDAVYDAISTTSRVDLGAAYVQRNTTVLASVALVVVVGLFVVQVVLAALRREPGGLGRAVVGAGVAVLGAAVAGSVVQLLLTVVDELCDGIAALAGTSIEDAARRLLDVSALAALATGQGGPALVLVFGLLFILGATLTLGTLLVRNALVVVAVVLAPLAFAGATSRPTAGWVRRWVLVTLALIVSKLAIVVVFVVAVGMLGDSRGLGALLSGLILLLVACMAPWACFKVLDFAGTQLATEWHHGTSGTAISAANQGRHTVQSLLRGRPGITHPSSRGAPPKQVEQGADPTAAARQAQAAAATQAVREREPVGVERSGAS